MKVEDISLQDIAKRRKIMSDAMAEAKGCRDRGDHLALYNLACLLEEVIASDLDVIEYLLHRRSKVQ